MKYSTLKVCVAMAMLSVVPTTGFAQDKPAGEKPAREGAARGQRGGDRWSPEARLKQMTEQLNLTQEQQDKIKALYEKNASALNEIRSKGWGNLSDEDKTKLRELMQSQREQIEAVLTDEQKQKVIKDMEQRRGRGRSRGEENAKSAQ
jgi:Spy/CpxP family protein refolding chaperone